jgi:hypothetical protein
MASYAFLSPEWIDGARAARAAIGTDSGGTAIELRMNLVVEEVPFGEGSIEAHVDTTAGLLDVELGHLPEPDVKVRLDYETARAVLVDGDPQAALTAFMAGKLRIEGDAMKLLEYQGRQISEKERELATALRDLTAP